MRKIAMPKLKRAAAAMKSAEKNQGWRTHYWQPLKLAAGRDEVSNQ
jgi:hypothetical protein